MQTHTDALRELSHRYMRGEISKPEYRQTRATFINQITGFVSEESTKNDDLSIEPGNTIPLRSSSFVKAGFISAVIAIMLVILFIVI